MSKSGRGISGADKQLQWAIILLASAVILPTVCLLWFMNQAVKNERLVVRQKLTDSYKGQMELLGRQIDDRWASRLKVVDTVANLNLEPAGTFAALVGASDKGQKSVPVCCSTAIFDTNGRLLYPIKDTQSDFDERPPEELAEAWNAEFVENNPYKAAQRYGQAAEIYFNSYIGRLAALGQVRCLKKAGNITEAISQCRQFIQVKKDDSMDPASASLIAQGRLLLITLKKENPIGLNKTDLEELIDWATNYSNSNENVFLPLSSSSRIFFLNKTIEILNKSPFADEFQNEISFARKLLYAEQTAALAIERIDSPVKAEYSIDSISNINTSLRAILEIVDSNNWPQQFKVDTNQAKKLLIAVQNTDAASEMFQKLQMAQTEQAVSVVFQPKDRLLKIGAMADKTGFGLYHNTANRIFLLLTTSEQLHDDFELLKDELDRMGLSYTITDNAGNYIAGSKSSDEKPFVTAEAGNYFQGWQISLFPSQSNLFEKAADEQIALYIWTSVLVIGLILVAGVLAARAVGRQIRLNTMKNNFIATVSHELKTPLASMRVLVDTLLEGNYNSERTVTEYLQLISKENIRLSNLIDNFLTFSRMERNKQAFEMVPTSPVEIANIAAEALRAKFESNKVLFEVTIEKSLPLIEADKDAMVTVLVNLMDNAYKYSRDDKNIHLEVFAGNGWVCFSVKDNGVGIPRRVQKRIFDRFYQADTKLSRRNEGCGLGLSIVKFIVDAHKGKIDVESRPGKGTIFTVKLPAERIAQ